MSRLADLLIRHRHDLIRFLERNAGRILRYETSEDLLQGIHLQALEWSASFEYRGREEFFGWMYQVARRYLSGRRAHWAALKRNPARLLRLTRAGSDSSRAVGEPAGEGTGPITFAARREQLTLAVQVLSALLPRDRDIIRWASEGTDDTEIARRLGITPAAAERARQRALERFRKAFAVLAGEKT